MAKLKIKDELGRERVHDLNDTVTVAGRASSNSIQINDEKSSRTHFKIERRDTGHFLEDLGSTNGTRLNGGRIAEPVKLRSGDSISVGKFTLIYEEADATDFPLHPTESSDALQLASAVPPAPQPPAPLPPQIADRATVLANDRQGELKNLHEESGKPQGGPKYVLKVIEGAAPGKIYELGLEPLTLGRHASNTIAIDDEAASNYHAEVAREPIGYVVIDLGSTNGTRVKPKSKSDFEKVVKTPLSPGMQIRIGKTLLEFQNIGEPVEEDQFFGTVALDPAKMDAQLAAAQSKPSGSSGMGFKLVAFAGIAAVIAAGVIFVPPLFKKKPGANPDVGIGPGTDEDPKGPKKPPKSAPNLVINGDFDQGTDELGNPKEFEVSKATDVIVKVSADADRQYDTKPDPAKRGLQIGKGVKSLSKPTIVETHDLIKIDPSKSYELSGWARNDDDGIYGLRVTWIQDEHILPDNAVILKDSQEWKEVKSPALTPPPWATHARVGVFAQGKNGKACFDELSFKEKSGTPAQQPLSVKNGGVTLQFEGTKGMFGAMSQGKVVLEDGTLRLEGKDGKSLSDVSSAFKPAQVKGGDSGTAGYEGLLYDFTQQNLTDYKVTAQQGASGVELRAALELGSESGSRPLLRFYIVGPAAVGEIELNTGGAAPERLTSEEDKTVAGVKGVLFNAGKTPQFSLAFAKPAEVLLKREGKRRLVEIRFDGELRIAMSPEDAEQKQQMLAEISELQKAVQAKDWGGVENKSKILTEKYGARFPQAQEESGKAKDALDAAWKSTQDELDRLVASLKNAATPELLEKAVQTAQRHAEAWKGSEKAAAVADTKAAIDAIYGKVLAVDDERKAEDNLKQAESYIERKIYNVAISILKVKILDDPKGGKTKAAERAKELLQKAQDAQKRKDDLDAITDRLKALIKNYQLTNKIREAIKTIETDPEYKANEKDLDEIRTLLDGMRKKLQ